MIEVKVEYQIGKYDFWWPGTSLANKFLNILQKLLLMNVMAEMPPGIVELTSHKREAICQNPNTQINK